MMAHPSNNNNETFRLTADKHWNFIRAAPDGVWTKCRFLSLQCYTSLLAAGMSIEPTPQDFENLEVHLVNNENEPNIFRVLAAFCLGCLYCCHKWDYEQAAEYSRRCVDLCDSATPEEQQRLEYAKMSNGAPRLRKLSLFFRPLKVMALEMLGTMDRCEREIRGRRARSGPGPWDIYSRTRMAPLSSDIPTEQMERRPGGATCDCCGVTRESTDRTSLLVCSRCKMAHYCSKECQVEQWKHRGHKKACRKPREFHPGDIVRYVVGDYDIMLRLNRLIDGEDGDGTLWWEVYDATWEGDLYLDVVEEDKLNHIRPADIV